MFHVCSWRGDAKGETGWIFLAGGMARVAGGFSMAVVRLFGFRLLFLCRLGLIPLVLGNSAQLYYCYT